jgi:hypothetical protein
MKVFLSWSGEVSREVATIFSEWLPSVLQAITPYFSPDIDKGARWAADIANELDTSDVGLLFLTKDNLEAPWILFEAGALSKSLEKSKVSPILLNIESTDLKGPLVQFQATPFRKEEIRKLIRTLNNGLSERGLSPQIFENTFEKWWPDLDERVRAALNRPISTNADIRGDRELLEEVLDITRNMLLRLSVSGKASDYQSLKEELRNFRTEFHSAIGRTFFTPIPASPEEEDAVSAVQQVLNEIEYKFSLMVNNGQVYPEINDLVSKARSIIEEHWSKAPALRNSRALVDFHNKLNRVVGDYIKIEKALTAQSKRGAKQS